MSEFDSKALEWDNNPLHWDRSRAIGVEMINQLPLNPGMIALEYGAGTAILSFILKDHVKEITMMDNSIGMVKVMNEKIEKTKVKNLKPLFFDLEHNDYTEEKFDLIFSQMVLHHVADIETLFNRFESLLNSDGFLAIADLYSEDGSFHEDGFTGHHGFDIENLTKIIEEHNFKTISQKQCFVVNRQLPNGKTKQFPVFLLVAIKK